MKGNTLVTGGSGFIGSHILNTLASNTQHKAVAYDLQGNCASNNHNAITIQGDIFNFDQLLKVMKDQRISNVIHMIGLASIPNCRKNPALSYQLNVASVQNVLEAMRQCDVERLIFPSTAAVYGITNGPKVSETAQPKSANIYGCHKYAAEMLIRGYAENYGLKSTILRIFNVYGDLDKEQGVVSTFLKKAFAGETLIIKGGEQLRDFIYLNNVVKAFTESLDIAASEGKTINVGSGIGLSIKTIAEMIHQSFPKVPIVHKPADQKEYSIFADVSYLKSIFNLQLTDPRTGIPNFIEECMKTHMAVSSPQ